MTADPSPLTLRASIEKVATGPEYREDWSFDAARSGTRLIAVRQADAVPAAAELGSATCDSLVSAGALALRQLECLNSPSGAADADRSYWIRGSPCPAATRLSRCTNQFRVKPSVFYTDRRNP